MPRREQRLDPDGAQPELVRPGLVPPPQIRELRELTRSLRDRTGANGVPELTPTAALLRRIALRARKAALTALQGKA